MASDPSIFSYGHISLLRPDHSTRRRFPLVKPSLSFGRLSTCDVRIVVETCSKLHATVEVAPEAPYIATLQVHSVNGLLHNGRDCPKGSVTQLCNNDELVICERIFKWESASVEAVISPAPAARKALRYSLIAAAKVTTPSKPSPAPVLSSLIDFSPLKPSSPFPARAELFDSLVAEALEEPEDLMSWDEQPEHEVDGPGGDLITWDEVEDAADELDEEIAAVEEESPQVEAEADLSEEEVAAAPATPARRASRAFAMVATPALADRARSKGVPVSSRKAAVPSTPENNNAANRRRSLRMTIVPSHRAIDWVKEREDRRELESAALAALQRPATPAAASLSPASATPIRAPATPARAPSTPSFSAVSTPRMASDSSSTSKRISLLLLSSSQGSSSNAGSFDDELLGDESESSEDEDDEEVADISVGEVRSRESIVASLEAEEQREDDCDAEADLASTALASASAIPLPASPYGSPTATPAPSPAPAQVQLNLTPRIPRYSLSRRHSLREKVLIRSAIKKAVTPPESPNVGPASRQLQFPASPVQQVAEAQLEEEQVEEEADEEEQVEEAQSFRISPQDVPLSETPAPIRPQDVPLPETIALTHDATPVRPPMSAHRDSLELVHSRSRSSTKPAVVVHSAVRVKAESATRMSVKATKAQVVEQSTPVVLAAEAEAYDHAGSPSPAERRTPSSRSSAKKPAAPVSARTTRVRVQAHAAGVPLPETPAGINSYSVQNTPQGTPIATTSLAFSFATPQQAASPSEHRDEFHSEMTSPVTQHRVMATPRSALRTGPRKKDMRGFLSAFAPPSTKPKVVFNEEVYIQEIVDIRDQRLHWNPQVDEPRAVDPASIPSPESPAVSMMTTPRRGRPATPAAPSSSVRRAQRVPTTTPCASVRKVLLEAQHLAPQSPRRVPACTPPPATWTPHAANSWTPGAGLHGTGLSVQPATPSASASPAVGVHASHVQVASATPVKGTSIKAASVFTPRTKASRKAEIQSLQKSPASRPTTFDSAVKPVPRSQVLLQQVEDLRRRQSMPAHHFQARQAPATPSTPVVVAPIEAVELAIAAPSTPRAMTPLRPLYKPMTLPTPNLASSFRRMFSSAAAPIPGTPNFSGFRNLFQGQTSATASPRLEGLQEMLKTPAATKRASVEVVASPIPVDSPVRHAAPRASIAPEVGQEDAQVVELEVREEVESEAEVEDVVSEVETPVEQPLQAAVVEEVQAPEVELAVVEDTEVEVTEMDVAEEPVLEPEVSEAAALPEASEEEIVPEVVEAAPVEDLVEDVVEVVVQELEQEIAESAKEVEAEVVEEALVAVAEVVEELVVEGPVARRGRTAKAPAAAKKATKAAPKKAKVVEVEPEPVHEEVVEVAELAAAPRSTRGAAAAGGTTRKAAARSAPVDTVAPEVEEAPVVAVPASRRGRAVMVEAAPAEAVDPVAEAPKAGRGRKARVVVEEAAPAVEEEAPAPATKAAPKARAPRGRAAARVAEVEEAVVEANAEPVVEAVAPAARGRKTKAKKVQVVEVVEESEEVAAVEDESVVEKKKPAPRKRVTKATLAVHEDEVPSAPEPVEEVAPIKATRGRRALQAATPPASVVAETKPVGRGKGKATTAAVELKENVVEVAPTRALRTRR